MIYKCASIFTITTIFISCANPVSPTGGPKDITPPIIITHLLDTTTSNDYNKITIEFDEYYNLKNEIYYNPQTKIQTKAKVSKESKKLYIEIPKLAKSYNLSNSVSDLNENNIGSYITRYFNNDTTRFSLLLDVPLYFNKEKKLLNAETHIDTLFYRSYQVQDTLYMDGLPNYLNEITFYIDQNKNNRYDSTEWYCQKDMDSMYDFHFYPPKKNRIEIDTTKGYAIVVTPYYLKPKSLTPPYNGDTFIMEIKQLYSWLNKNNTTIPTYKKIKYPVFVIKEKKIINTDTITIFNSPYPSTILKQSENIDTIIKTTHYGHINFSNRDSVNGLDLLLINKQHIYINISLTQQQDSINIPAGEYNLLLYYDKNQDGVFSGGEKPDIIYNYFDKISVTSKLSNVITIGKSMEKPSIFSGQTTPSNLKSTTPKKSVNTTISIPD